MLVKCENCSKEVYKKPSQVKRTKRSFCSDKCHNELRHKENVAEMSKKVGMDFKAWLEIKYIEEKLSTRKIAILIYGNEKCFNSVGGWLRKFNIPLRHGSEAVKTQWINNDERRKLSRDIAKKTMLKKEVRDKIRQAQQTEEYKMKQSISKTGKKNGMYGVRGEKSPRWNNNLTDYERVVGRKTIKDTIWREKVYEKDNYTCVVCGDNRGGNLNAHHLYSHNRYIDKRYDVNNGVTLCEACHKAFHDKYGYGDNTKEQFDEFINSRHLLR